MTYALTVLAALAAPPSAANLGSPTTGFVEMGAAANVCGARGAADCDAANTGFGLDVRGAWQATDWLAIGGTVAYLSLPSETPGHLVLFGPEVTLRYRFAGWHLQTALAVGYDALFSDADTLGGLGGLRWSNGGRVAVTERLYLGLDYALVAPRFDDNICSESRCARVAAALAHQFGLLVGVGFW